jgi:hypothetical protein
MRGPTRGVGGSLGGGSAPWVGVLRTGALGHQSYTLVELERPPTGWLTSCTGSWHWQLRRRNYRAEFLSVVMGLATHPGA